MTKSRLLHPILNEIPVPFRFVLSGVIGNAIFIAAFNMALNAFQEVTSASVVFAVVQFFCIILNHFLNVGIVFGWPDHYLTSLMTNMPVGITSLMLGAGLTSKLDEWDFDAMVNEFLQRDAISEDGQKGGFWVSIAVMTATGIFNYIALNIVNSTKDEKTDDKNKEL